MIDETDPVVRAIQAPFEANMGDFYRRIKDANASYQEEMDKLDKEKAEAEEEHRRQLEELAAKDKKPEPEKPARPSQEWDYNDPLASAQSEPRRWPSSLPSPQHAQARQESTSDDEEPVYERRRYRATWAEPAQEAEPEPQSWSPPPAAPPSPPPARRSRPAARDDEDYSNESWMQ